MVSKTQKAIDFLNAEGFKNAIRLGSESPVGHIQTPGLFNAVMPQKSMQPIEKLSVNNSKPVTVWDRLNVVSESDSYLKVALRSFHESEVGRFRRERANADYIDDGASRRREILESREGEVNCKLLIWPILKDVLGIDAVAPFPFDSKQDEFDFGKSESGLDRNRVWLNAILSGEQNILHQILLEWLPNRPEVWDAIRAEYVSSPASKMPQMPPVFMLDSSGSMSGVSRFPPSSTGFKLDQSEVWSKFVSEIERHRLKDKVIESGVLTSCQKAITVAL